MTRFGSFEGLSILGSGKALPERSVSTQELAVAVGLPPETLQRMSGVETRHWTHVIGEPADHSEPNSQDLAVEAARRALADANLEPEAVKGLLLVTTTPPRPSVNTGNHVAKALGLGGFTLELKAGCAGALYGIVTAASMMALGAQPLLLVATEAWTKLVPPGMPGPMAVAGDGAAALVLGQGAGAFLGGALHTAPESAAAMMPPGLFPPTSEAIARGDYQIRVTEDVAELVRDFYPQVFDEALGVAGLAREAVDLFIPHQASQSIVRRALRDCGIPPERAFHTLSRYGNASSASILLSLHAARSEGRLKPGQTLAMTAVGGGITAASIILRI